MEKDRCLRLPAHQARRAETPRLNSRPATAGRLHGAGFTLIEVMIVIAILSILAGIALPAFNTLIASNRLAGQANDLLSAFQLARSEAVTRGNRVSVCASSGGTTCIVMPSDTDVSWNTGWMVFEEPPGGTTGTFDAGVDTILRVYPALAGSSTLSAGTVAVVTYRPNGQAGSNVDFLLCPNDNSGVSGRVIQVSASGRARVDRDTAGACS